jgi:hypothetical protein
VGFVHALLPLGRHGIELRPLIIIQDGTNFVGLGFVEVHHLGMSISALNGGIGVQGLHLRSGIGLNAFDLCDLIRREGEPLGHHLEHMGLAFSGIHVLATTVCRWRSTILRGRRSGGRITRLG